MSVKFSAAASALAIGSGLLWAGPALTAGGVTMLEAILLAAGRRAVAAGNVGRPLVEVVTAVGDGVEGYEDGVGKMVVKPA